MNFSDYDVIIAGGSLSGLLSAQEIANHGNDVLVLEEHSVIGLPEKCDGLVSLNALSSLGIIPNWKIIQNIESVFYVRSLQGFTHIWWNGRKRNTIGRKNTLPPLAGNGFWPENE